MDRREFIKRSVLSGLLVSPFAQIISSCGGGGGTVLQPGMGNMNPDEPAPQPPPDTDGKNPLLLPGDSGLLGFFSPQGEFTFTAKTIQHQIAGIGGITTLMVYEVQSGGKTYINPIIRIRKGDSFKPTLRNELDEETVIHWHGLRVDFKNDGHPYFAITKGEELRYDFKIIDRSGSFWYHPHPHGRTGYQAYFGLASMFIIEDEDEDRIRNALDLEPGSTDIPLIIQDKSFNPDGSLFYQQRLMGFYGNVPTVNLTVNPYLGWSREFTGSGY
jgi:suppressor of ftsI/bilirubin oxidase